MVVGGDEVWCGPGPGLGSRAAHGLPVQDDGPSSSRDRCSGPQVGAEHEIEGVGFHTCERTTDRGLPGALAIDTEVGQSVGGLPGDPLTGSNERACSGQYRCQPYGHNRGQPMLEPARVSRIGHGPQQAQQIRAGRRGTCGRTQGPG